MGNKGSWWPQPGNRGTQGGGDGFHLGKFQRVMDSSEQDTRDRRPKDHMEIPAWEDRGSGGPEPRVAGEEEGGESRLVTESQDGISASADLLGSQK